MTTPCLWPRTRVWVPMRAYSSVSSPEFFDISSHKCARVFTFTDLDSCVLTMNYW